MAYLDEVPDYVVFYCQEPAEHGQKTNLIGDMRAFTEKLPEQLQTRRFRGKRARLRRRLPPAGEKNGVYKDKKSWQESLGTGDRGQAQRIARQRGWELAWTDDDCLEITQEPARFFRPHPIHGELWCTQAMVFQPESWRLVAERDGRTADAEQLAETMASAPESLARMIMGRRHRRFGGGVQDLVQDGLRTGNALCPRARRGDHPRQHADRARAVDVHRLAAVVRRAWRPGGLAARGATPAAFER